MHTPFKVRSRLIGEKTVEALKKRGFDAYYCDDKEEAKEKVLSLIPKDHVVGWGGTVSMADIGIMDIMRSGEYKVLDRDTAKTPAERVEIMTNVLHCDTFIMGTNAISQDGQLVNIDGNGNRVAALCYGPKSVVMVVGINKLAKTVDDALTRARNVAAPTNIHRFPDRKTPCMTTGTCNDCTSPDCSCAQMVITRMCAPQGRIKVVIVGENLGF